ncbi:MAG: KEOPS complex subunit Cgi121 [Promethearchaeota archaeon]
MNVGTILNQISTEYSLSAVQLFDNRYIWSYRHLYSAVWHALNAKNSNQMISKSLSMEVLLYVAAQRQIKKAITLLGIRESTKVVVGLLIGENSHQVINGNNHLKAELELIPNINFLNDYSSKRQYFIDMLAKNGFPSANFTFSEIEKAVLQQIALLALE